jgi:SAM-dependent methyltransferase
MPNTVKKISRRVRDKLRVVRTRLGLRKESPKAPPPPTDHESGRSLYNTVGFLDATAAGWFQTKTRELFRDFPINDTDTVLDVGCGLGYNLKFCAQYAAKSIGIDIDPTRVKATDDLLRNSGIKNFKVITSDGNLSRLILQASTKLYALRCLSMLTTLWFPCENSFASASQARCTCSVHRSTVRGNPQSGGPSFMLRET